jgi:signal transduction histidine kinase
MFGIGFIRSILMEEDYGRSRLKADLKSAQFSKYSDFEDSRVMEILHWEALTIFAGGINATISDYVVMSHQDSPLLKITLTLNLCLVASYFILFQLFRDGRVYKKIRPTHWQTILFSLITLAAGIFWVWLSPTVEKASILFLIVLITPVFGYSVGQYLLYAITSFIFFLMGQFLRAETGLSQEFFKAMNFAFPMTMLCMVFMILNRRRTLQTLFSALADLRQEKVATAQMAKLSALGEMAGGIAHEINNPLTVIQLHVVQAQTLQKSGSLTEKVLLDNLEKIHNTTSRISKIISGLRTFSRDGVKDPFERVDVHRLVNETLSLCSEKFRYHNVELKVSLEENLEVKGRLIQLGQVLLNLMNNAFDAIQSYPQKWIQLQASIQGEWVEIRVTDCGSGIPEEVATKMMQPFFTTKEVGKGTGLGLSISKGIIEDHHGKFFLDRQNPNTSFVIQLPIYSANEKS